MAIAGRSFIGARSHSAVLIAGIPKDVGDLPPKIRQSWVAADPAGNIYIADTNNNRVQEIAAAAAASDLDLVTRT